MDNELVTVDDQEDGERITMLEDGRGFQFEKRKWHEWHGKVDWIAYNFYENFYSVTTTVNYRNVISGFLYISSLHS